MFPAKGNPIISSADGAARRLVRTPPCQLVLDITGFGNGHFDE